MTDVIVEDGTGIEDADAYVSVEDADTYHTNHGKGDAWGEVENKNAALRVATQYLDALFGALFTGSRAVEGQALEWPRAEATDARGNTLAADAVPKQILIATCELALRAGSSDLMADQVRGGRIKTQTLGELSQTFFDDAPSGTTFPFISTLLASLIGGGGSRVYVERG